MSEVPPTAPVPTGWRSRFDLAARLHRVRDSLPAIAQLVVAATLAYLIAHIGLGHEAPLLAATVTISSLGLARDAHPLRVLETVVGMVVGILVAELLLVLLGAGWWQLGVALAATLLVSRVLSSQSGFAIAAAIQSLIVMVLPASAPGLRLVDGAIGGVVALVVTALIPRSPLRRAVADGEALFAGLDNAIGTVAQALLRGDRVRAERALEKARALQGPLEQWRGSVEAGAAIARISPFLRRQRSELARQQRMLAHADFATRNLRVIARRCVYLIGDGEHRPVAADLLIQLRVGTALLGGSLADISLQPAAREAIRAVARRLDPEIGAGSGDQNLVAALRPLAVDLLVATGMEPADARGILPSL